MGVSNPARAWLNDVCRLAAAVPADSLGLLLQMTPARYAAIWHYACDLAGLPRANLHRLRHGGASADAIAGLDDAAMLERGSWRSVRSIARYRRPGRYLLQLSKLTPCQLAAAECAPSRIIQLMRELMRYAKVPEKSTGTALTTRRARPPTALLDA